jgi:hypothetical protein
MSKLLANLLAWRKYTGERYGIGELVERLLGRVLLPVAEGGWEVGGENVIRKVCPFIFRGVCCLQFLLGCDRRP